MPDSGAQLQPAEVTKLTCPRCHFAARFVPLAALEFRCSRCEWAFNLAAPSVSTPAVPSSGSPSTNLVTNTTGTVAAVTITGGTLTFVYVNGSQVGTTAGIYLVPVGGTISVTYSVAPTWAWALPTTSASAVAGGTSLTFAPTGTNVAFTAEQVLIVDPSGTSDVVKVTSGATATSVPVNSLNLAHNSGVSVAVAVLTPALSAVEAVPQTTF
jgi:hypothetical protein